MLVPLPDLLADAAAHGYVVGYFEAWDAYSLEAVVEAAEEERAPVVLGFGCLLAEPAWLDDGGIELLGGIGRASADRARFPAALLLNEARTLEQALRGVDAGFNAVMPTAQAPGDVARLVGEAHARGVAVEAALGELPTADGGGTLTDPTAAAAFVEATGVDCLAVSVGNVHMLTGRSVTLDLELLESVHRRVPVPLVLHGGSSVPAEAVAAAAAHGVAKINVGTVLKERFLEGVRDGLGCRGAGVHDLLGSHGKADLLVAGKARMAAAVRELIRLYGASGRG